MTSQRASNLMSRLLPWSLYKAGRVNAERWMTVDLKLWACCVCFVPLSWPDVNAHAHAHGAFSTLTSPYCVSYLTHHLGLLTDWAGGMADDTLSHLISLAFSLALNVLEGDEFN